MIVKIGRGSNLYGALAYNLLKMENEKGQILLANKMIETPNGQYSAGQLAQSFALYLIANQRTEKPVLHISLNPDPKDKVSDEKFRQMAGQYMQEMGYGQQPFVVFKHTDIGRVHIHIVSVCVDEAGKKISDSFEKRRSMKVCRALEEQYNLMPATDKQQRQNDKIFRPVNYIKGDVKSQLASVIRHLPKYYQFRTLGEYNALLSLFNITTERVEGQVRGKMKGGLLYFPLNEEGKKASHPFKSSLFGNNAGLPALEDRFEKCSESLKNSNAKNTIKSAINISMIASNDEQGFLKQLTDMGINVVVRRNDTGRIYGITFIDHNSKTVWNGSRLGKMFSANVFNNYWNHNIPLEINEPNESQQKVSPHHVLEDVSAEKPHEIFGFLNNETVFGTDKADIIIESLGGLLPDALGENYEEQEFANRMKKKKKHRRKQ
ncbi:conjugal transfer protein MobB [Salegentibacter sp. Hel_I_6]|uniref:conjugal transfer protein MobB n=1 Tax=Salegentibacter sp. Hel_I_6 TaxID=1250278 RepID=UPI00056B7CFE|nr:conjugal transfer protein MobB [Salegentibacter sp. Hel_I_6]